MRNNQKNLAWLVSFNGDLEAVAKEVLHAIGSRPAFIELHGEMGAGKTTLAHALLTEARISGKFLGSPSFPILHRYSTERVPGVAFHLDLYRVSGDQELEERGVVDSVWLEPALLLVEWASIAPRFTAGLIQSLYTESAFILSVDLTADNSRAIRLSQVES